MCTGRVDLAFVLRALQNGKDGVFIGGCWPGECHYITEGNFMAFSVIRMAKKLLEWMGLNPDRLRLEYVSASEGTRYAEVMNDFSKTVRQLGPIGKGEGIDEAGLKRKLQAAYDLVPYIKLVERERMRVPVKTAEAYRAFYESREFDDLFGQLVTDKLEMGQIMALLREKPRNASELSEILGVAPTEVTACLNTSARQGLIEFDQEQKRFIPV